MKIIVSKEDRKYIEESIKSGEVLKEDLRRWFKEKWVDVSKKVDGKHPPCGRKDADGKSYPQYHQSITNVQQEYLQTFENMIDSSITLETNLTLPHQPRTRTNI